MTTTVATPRPHNFASLAPLLLLVASLVFAYWTCLGELASTWNSNPQYSHGFLVPVFAGFLLWHRRDRCDLAAMRPNLVGLALIVIGLVMKLAGVYGHYVSLDSISLVPCVAGIVWLTGGWPAWRWAWPAVLFLAFMIPLPYFAAVAMSGQLQWIATITSTFVMQTLGLPALSEGNVILLNDHEIGIVEACSGLRMLVVFFALSTAVVFVIQRHWIDRLVILFSAIPIALVANITRVTATGIMYEAGYSEMANHFFHDVAGWLMMPLALGLLWVELKLLAALFVDKPSPTPARVAAAPPIRGVVRPPAKQRGPTKQVRQTPSRSEEPAKQA